MKIIFWGVISLMCLLTVYLMTHPFKKNTRIILFLAIGFLILGFYFKSDRYQALNHYISTQHQVSFVKQDIKQSGKPTHLIAQLKKRTQQNPTDARAWYFLGKLYLSINQYVKALDALKNAKKHAPKDSAIYFTYAQAYFLKNGKLSDTTKQCLVKQSEGNPSNINLLNLLALDAYKKKQFSKAKGYWEKILSQLPKNAKEDREVILKMIQQIKK